jgi:uncharacterized phage-associated protein
MEQFKYFPSHIANFFLWLSKKDKSVKGITNMQLIKLTYFAYAWFSNSSLKVNTFFLIF